ncbi:TPA: hypothetical protein ACS735_003607 [Providencia alcalifaciens]
MLINKDPLAVRKQVELFKSKILELLPDENDSSRNLLCSMFKHAAFYNALILLNDSISHKSYINGMTYDALNCIISLAHRRERSLHLNIRSIIEHAARIALNKNQSGGDFDGTVRRRNFDTLKQNSDDGSWKFLHDSYIRACQYIHSSPNANLNIAATFTELLDGDFTSRMQRQTNITQRIISESTKMLIRYLEPEISNCFLRTQTELEFLIGRPNFIFYRTIKELRVTSC